MTFTRYRFLLLSLVALLATALPLPAQPQRTSTAAWETSVVTLEVARKQYDYYQPWSRRTTRLRKTGIVVDDRHILTTADELFDRTLVRLQKMGRGRWWTGDVVWVDYHANLALVTTDAADFWRDLKPATLGGDWPTDGGMQILRWHDGNLENRRAEFTRFAVRDGQLCPLSQAVVEVDSDIPGAGQAEPLTANSHVVGLLTSQENRVCIAIPASFIRQILKGHQDGQYRGLGYFHFYWQQAENPVSLARLKLTGESRGVMVIDVPERPDAEPAVLKPQDLILKIDGFDLDIQGDYQDPEFGHLLLENLATRNKWAGDNVKMQIWRDGHEMDVTYRLPRFQYTNSLVPSATYDQEPEYAIVGGLVFQPLTDSYLQSWGAEWKHRSPFRLFYYRNESPSPKRPSLVVLSQVLPDAYNIGYQEQRYLVLEKVNGQTVRRLADLRAALKQPTNGFHLLEFAKGESLQKIVLNAEDESQATQRILKRYGITEAYHSNTDR